MVNVNDKFDYILVFFKKFINNYRVNKNKCKSKL